MNKSNDNSFIKKITTEKWTLDKDKKDTLKKHAKSRGEDPYVFLNRAIEETIKRDNEDGVYIPLDKKQKAAFEKHAEEMGESLEDFILRAIKETKYQDFNTVILPRAAKEHKIKFNYK